MIQRVLIENGLSEKEATLYIAALQAGEAPLGYLANKSKLKRSTVYSLVSEMKKKGLLSLLKKNGVQYVSALSPRLLIDRFAQATERAEGLLPQLIDLSYSSPVKPRIQFYDGLDGLKEILTDAASAVDDYCGFTDYEQMPKELYQFIHKKVIPLRSKHETKLRLIVPNNSTNLNRIKKYQKTAEYRLIDYPSQRNHMEILLYEESKIGFLSYDSREMFGIVMDSEAMHATLYDLFAVLWSQLGSKLD